MFLLLVALVTPWAVNASGVDSDDHPVGIRAMRVAATDVVADMPKLVTFMPEEHFVTEFPVRAREAFHRKFGEFLDLKIPPQALPRDGVFRVETVAPSNLPPFPEGAEPLGPAFDLKYSAGVEFRQPLQLTLTFDESQLVDGGQPAVFSISEDDTQWQYLGGTVVAPGKIQVTVDHFSIFAVFPRQRVHFVDMQGHWAQPHLQRLVAMYVISGYPGGYFRPEQTVTRAEFTKMIATALGLPHAAADREWADEHAIPAWAKDYASAAVAAGIIQGYRHPNGTIYFRPDQPITRAEIAVILDRIIGWEANHVTVRRFLDQAGIPEWAAASIQKAVAFSVLNGYPDGTFRPNRPATRAEAAKIIDHMLNVLGI